MSFIGGRIQYCSASGEGHEHRATIEITDTGALRPFPERVCCSCLKLSVPSPARARSSHAAQEEEHRQSQRAAPPRGRALPPGGLVGRPDRFRPLRVALRPPLLRHSRVRARSAPSLSLARGVACAHPRLARWSRAKLLPLLVPVSPSRKARAAQHPTAGACRAAGRARSRSHPHARRPPALAPAPSRTRGAKGSASCRG
jgi:hypothetical protein